jgi:hypothetical protein
LRSGSELQPPASGKRRILSGSDGGQPSQNPTRARYVHACTSGLGSSADVHRCTCTCLAEIRHSTGPELQPSGSWKRCISSPLGRRAAEPASRPTSVCTRRYIRVHPSIKSAFALRPRIAAIGGRETTHYQPAWTAGSGSRIQINNGFLEPCEIVSDIWILTDFDQFSYTSKICTCALLLAFWGIPGHSGLLIWSSKAKYMHYRCPMSLLCLILKFSNIVNPFPR